jgi:hypothetical protein
MSATRWTTSAATLLAALTVASTASAAGVCSAQTPQYCPVPAVQTGAAANVTDRSATLTGSVNPAGAATSCVFFYGTTTKYDKATGTQSVGSGASSAPVRFTINGLSATTTYHFVLFCANAGRFNAGSDRTFTTKAVVKSKIAIAKRKGVVSKKKGLVKFILVCQSSVLCKGKLSLTKLGGARLASPRTYTIGGHTRKAIFMTLTRKALRQLKQSKHHRMQARARAVDRDGPKATRVVTLILQK